MKIKVFNPTSTPQYLVGQDAMVESHSTAEVEHDDEVGLLFADNRLLKAPVTVAEGGGGGEATDAAGKEAGWDTGGKGGSKKPSPKK